MLYTPLSMDDIFPRDPEDHGLMEWWVEGRLCLVRRDKEGAPRLERLLSTNPEDYLDERFQPHRLLGTILI